MSLVTNAILVMSVIEEDEERLQEVNKFFGDSKGFVSVDDPSLPRGWYGGTKVLEIWISIGSFNYLRLDELVEHLKAISWEEPENVQLMICEQEDGKFRVIEPFTPPKPTQGHP